MYKSEFYQEKMKDYNERLQSLNLEKNNPQAFMEAKNVDRRRSQMDSGVDSNE
jgi:hypothetical protein